MKVTVCIGSSCAIKGSRRVVDALQTLIAQHNVQDKVELAGTFCLGRCQDGVCVLVDGDFCSVKPETVEDFFTAQVLQKL